MILRGLTKKVITQDLVELEKLIFLLLVPLTFSQSSSFIKNFEKAEESMTITPPLTKFCAVPFNASGKVWM